MHVSSPGASGQPGIPSETGGGQAAAATGRDALRVSVGHEDGVREGTGGAGEAAHCEFI